MEEANQDAFDRARLQVIKDSYEKAFECINRGLTEDEAGHKAQALAQYTQGRQHLLRAISVPSQGDECVGSSWVSARQMQHKMQETLNNITTRLAAIETGPDPELPPPLDASHGVPGTASNSNLYPKLEKEKPERPSPPKLLMTNRQAGAVGGSVFPSLPLSPTRQSVVPGELPPAYSSQAADGHLTISYGTESGEMSLVGEEFYSHISPSPPSPQSLGEDGEELFFLPHGVQIFFVTPDGQVSAPSYPGYLRMVKFTSQQSERVPNRPPAFLQVCDWLYPLMATDSPVLLCNTGVFMFPDMMASAPGSYVGVVLSSELPVEDRQLFQDLLSQMTDLRVQAPNEAADSINLSQKVSITPLKEEEAPAAGEEEEEEEKKNLPEWSEKVASGILTGASWLSWGLVKGAEFTGIAIQKGASKLREHITPEDKPAHVSPSVSKGLHVAKQATGGAVRVSQFLVDGVCMVAGCVGRELAPHVKKHGGKLVPESMKKDKDGRSNIDGAMVVAASGVQGFATMWTGLEVAAKNITVSVASETVNTVKHKYGAAAGQATDHAVNSAINMGVTAFNIDNLGIKAAVKKTGKQTAVAILEDYQLRDPNTNQKQVEKRDK